MKTVIVVAIICSAAIASAQQAQVPQGGIADLLARGRAGKFDGLTQTCGASRNRSIIGGLIGGGWMQAGSNANEHSEPTAYTVTLMAARGWIANRAGDAARTKTPLTESDVPAAWLASALWVVVEPQMPAGHEPGRLTALAVIGLETDSDRRNVPPTERPIAMVGELAHAARTWTQYGKTPQDYDSASAAFDPVPVLTLRGDRIAVKITTANGVTGCDVDRVNVRKLLTVK